MYVHTSKICICNIGTMGYGIVIDQRVTSTISVPFSSVVVGCASTASFGGDGAFVNDSVRETSGLACLGCVRGDADGDLNDDRGDLADDLRGVFCTRDHH